MIRTDTHTRTQLGYAYLMLKVGTDTTSPLECCVANRQDPETIDIATLQSYHRSMTIDALATATIHMDSSRHQPMAFDFSRR